MQQEATDRGGTGRPPLPLGEGGGEGVTPDYRDGRRGLERLTLVRKLRRDTTPAESRLWARIRAGQILGAKFRRQHEFGPYILDFYCPSYQVAIEVDGGQHFEQEGVERDYARDEYLRSSGIRVLRFTNLEVMAEIEGVADKIIEALEATPSPPPSPRGRGGRPLRRDIRGSEPKDD